MPHMTTPAEFHVFVDITPTKANGASREFTSCIARVHDEAAIGRAIKADLEGMRKTGGGVIEPGSVSGRTYRAFRAAWTEVAIPG